MTKKEIIEKNIGMTFDFLRYLVDHPELIDDIPNSAVIEFVDKEIAVKETVAKTRKGKAVSFQVERTFKPVKPASHPGQERLDFMVCTKGSKPQRPIVYAPISPKALYFQYDKGTFGKIGAMQTISGSYFIVNCKL